MKKNKEVLKTVMNAFLAILNIRMKMVVSFR